MSYKMMAMRIAMRSGGRSSTIADLDPARSGPSELKDRVAKGYKAPVLFFGA